MKLLDAYRGGHDNFGTGGTGLMERLEAESAF
jgi:hypothetical protein